MATRNEATAEQQPARVARHALLSALIYRKEGCRKAMRRISEQTKKILVVTAIACIAAFVSTRSSAAPPSAPADAASTYKSKCASCHGANGSGQTPAGKAMKLRDLRSAEVQAQSEAQLYAIITKGKGKMHGYEKSLGADTCKALVAYTRQLAGK